MTPTNIAQKCLLPSDPDMSGPGIRLALTIPVIVVILLSLVWTVARTRASPELLRKLTTALCHLNALQLTTATVFLAIVWSKQDRSDWLHLQLALNTAALGGWSTSLAAIAMPGWFTKKMFQLPALVGYLCLFILNVRRFQHAILHTDPACLSHHFCVMQPSGMWIGIALVILLFAILALFNYDIVPAKTNYESSRPCIKLWKSRYVFILQTIPFFWIIVGLWVTFYCYAVQKPFLREHEDEWTPGQILPTCFVVIGSVAELWNTFEMDVIVSNFIKRSILFTRDSCAAIVPSMKPRLWSICTRTVQDEKSSTPEDPQLPALLPLYQCRTGPLSFEDNVPLP